LVCLPMMLVPCATLEYGSRAEAKAGATSSPALHFKLLSE
jgi:hypothetical protein